MDLLLNTDGLNETARTNGVNSLVFSIRNKDFLGIKYELFAGKTVSVPDVHAHILIRENPTLIKQAAVSKSEPKQEAPVKAKSDKSESKSEDSGKETKDK